MQSDVMAKKEFIINGIQWEVRIFTIHHRQSPKVEVTPPSHSLFFVCVLYNFSGIRWENWTHNHPDSVALQSQTLCVCLPSWTENIQILLRKPKRTDFKIYIKRWDESRLQSAAQGMMEEKKKWRGESEVNTHTHAHTHTDGEAVEANSWALLPPSGQDQNWNSAWPRILYFLFFLLHQNVDIFVSSVASTLCFISWEINQNYFKWSQEIVYIENELQNM